MNYQSVSASPQPEDASPADAAAAGAAARLTRRERLRRGWRGWRASHLKFRLAQGLTLLESGTDYFAALVREIDAAQHTVRLETYIFCHDDAGQLVDAALRRAAARGVDVRVITDGVGTARLPMLAQWPAEGIRHRIFNPHLWGRNGVARDHRKLAAVDHRVAWVGGMNIVDDWMNEGRRMDAPRWDFAVQMHGSMVRDVVAAFDIQWARVDPKRRPAAALSMKMRRQIRWQRHFLKRSGIGLTQFGANAQSGDAVPPPQIALVARDNRLNRRAIERAYLVAIDLARERIVLANPYFTPGRRLRRALNDAARRGVDVQLLIGRKEFRLLDWAVPSLYGSFLRAGIRVAEYNVALLHGKVAVIDDVWATVGSSNLDALSLFLNHEANVVIVHDPVIVQLQKAISSAFGQADEIDRNHYAARRWPERLLNWAAYTLYRAVMRLLTVGRFD